MIMLELSRASFDCLLDHASETLPELFKPRGKDNESGYVSLGSQVNVFCIPFQDLRLLPAKKRRTSSAAESVELFPQLQRKQRHKNLRYTASIRLNCTQPFPG